MPMVALPRFSIVLLVRIGGSDFKNERATHFQMGGPFLSGWQDSNLRLPAPKAGALTGLRYTP